APPLAVVPTQRASVLVALAGMGGTPVNKSAGKATKLPPPATALMAPPRAPAKKRKMPVWMFKPVFYHDWRQVLQQKAPFVRCIRRPDGIRAAIFLFSGAKSFLDNSRRPVYERGN